MAGISSLTLIGAGRMGEALLKGWIGVGVPELNVFDPEPSDTVKDWSKRGLIHLNPAPAPASILILAVKPQVFTKSAGSLKIHSGKNTRIISIMAGIRLRQLEEHFGTSRIVRAMPNTPGAIGQGITVLSAPDDVAKSDIAAARHLLASLGDVEGPVPETLMGAVTGLSGSGPAYIFLLTEVLALAGESEGLPAPLARKLARRTVEGAARLMQESGEEPAALRKAVTSPGGTTQAALDVLMDDAGLAMLMRKALRAAVNRDRDLSRSPD